MSNTSHEKEKYCLQVTPLSNSRCFSFLACRWCIFPRQQRWTGTSDRFLCRWMILVWPGFAVIPWIYYYCLKCCFNFTSRSIFQTVNRWNEKLNPSPHPSPFLFLFVFTSRLSSLSILPSSLHHSFPWYLLHALIYSGFPAGLLP